MPHSISAISNTAVRIFLQKFGKDYDIKRGFKPLTDRLNTYEKKELLNYFNYECCFCGKKFDNNKNFSRDHLIPQNKESLGLHAWGNVVYCCKSCNDEKNKQPWEDFLKSKSENKNEFENRKAKLKAFISDKKYEIDVDFLRKFAKSLYIDVGEVAMALIDLRYKQAGGAESKK